MWRLRLWACRRPSRPAPRSCAPYGNIANAGVHGKPVELPINTMWISNVNINMGLVNCNTVGNLLNMVRSVA